MNPRLERTPPPQPGRAPSPRVIGLEDVGKHAKGQRRRKRLRNRVRSGFLGALGLTLIGAGAWIGYAFYSDYQDREEAERERRVSVLERERADETMIDVIEELQTEPRFNGPGVPALGIGTDEP